MDTYNRLPVSFKKGRGVWLIDYHGNKYLDATSGYGVCSLGHCNKLISKAIRKQSKRLIHTSNLFHVPEQEKLAAVLSKKSGMEKVYFCNSGSEANEAAIKLSRLYGVKKGYKTPLIITLKSGFHGRTMGSLSATDQVKIKKDFEPNLPGFEHAPINDFAYLRSLVEKNKEIVAIMLEPIQGVGGVKVANQDYLKSLRKFCTENDLLLIFDEVQTGIARTGEFFAYQNFGVFPDVVTSAKALANGIPIGACLSRGSASALFNPGDHGTTFGGNPFVATVGLAVLDYIERFNLVETVKSTSKYLFNALNKKLAGNKNIIDIRGMGLMVGIEMSLSAQEIVKACLHENLLITAVAGNTVRLLPPLIILKREIDLLVNTLSNAILKIGGAS